MFAVLMFALVFQDYGWNSYPPGYTRMIFNDDLTQSAVVPAVPIANLSSTQKLPVLVTPINNAGGEANATNIQFTVKPTGAGVVQTVNAREYMFIPTSTYNGLGMINISATNARGDTIIGQIHFMIR